MEPNSPSKTKKSLYIWLGAAAAVLAVTLCAVLYLRAPAKAGGDVEQRTITMTDLGFDTPITFRTTCSEEQFSDYLGILRDTFTECSELFDPYNKYEDATSLLEVNENAADHPVQVDEKVIEVWNDSKKAHQLNPKFDVAQGRLIELWKNAREADTPVLPTQQEIDASINPDSMDAVVVEGDTISFTKENTALDFGAIAKGYTTQLAADRLEEAGMEYGYINAGGNVVLIGQKPDGSDWKVGIQDPDTSDSLVLYTSPDPTCLVTSGDYQRYMTVDGKNYSHIIDPDTGWPETYCRSVTVIDDDSAYCDAMSTALFCLPVDEGLQLCRQLDLQAVWICAKGSCDLPADLSTDSFDIYYTHGLKDSISLKEQS